MIRWEPSSLMVNYSRIKKVAPSRSHLVVAVGGNRRIEEGEVNYRGVVEGLERSGREVR